MVKNILFVCTGNTCRSSMAEALFRDMIEKAGKDVEGIKVQSAGVAAIPNLPASSQAIDALRDHSIDLTYHRSKPLTTEMIEEADLILTMTINHKNAVLNMSPSSKEKVFTLKEYAFENNAMSEALNIQDPYGQPVEVYRQSAQEIKEALVKVLRKLGTGDR